jgi:hypothetical protein
MNRNGMLREMGIKVWIPKEFERSLSTSPPTPLKASESKVSIEPQEPVMNGEVAVQVQSDIGAPVITPTSTTTAATKPTLGIEIKSKHINTEEQEISEALGAIPALEMKWSLVFDQNDTFQSKLGQQILRAIENLGVTYQLIELGLKQLQPSHIEGQVLIAFGQKVGQLVSGEHDAVEHLRGIIFEGLNQDGEEIPALVTYSLSDLMRSPKSKSSFWDDLLWARSVWIDSRLY